MVPISQRKWEVEDRRFLPKSTQHVHSKAFVLSNDKWTYLFK